MELSTSDTQRTYENALIIDNRNPLSPQNKLIVVCEHATNHLPQDYTWSSHDQNYFKNDHWGSDLGALGMAKSLAVGLRSLLLQSLYSRLLVDINRDIGSEGLFRKRGDAQEIDLNKNMSIDEENKRLEKYHFGFYEALKDISDEINPKFWISVHSFTPLYEGKKRFLEIGILVPEKFMELGKIFNDEFLKRGYHVSINQPYDARKMIVAGDSMFKNATPIEREWITFEFRNDLLTTDKNRDKLFADTLEIVKIVIKEKNIED